MLLQKYDRCNDTLRRRLVGVDDGFGVPLPVIFEVGRDFVVGPNFGVLSHNLIKFLLCDVQNTTYWIERAEIGSRGEVVLNLLDDGLAY